MDKRKRTDIFNKTRQTMTDMHLKLKKEQENRAKSKPIQYIFLVLFVKYRKNHGQKSNNANKTEYFTTFISFMTI